MTTRETHREPEANQSIVRVRGDHEGSPYVLDSLWRDSGWAIDARLKTVTREYEATLRTED